MLRRALAVLALLLLLLAGAPQIVWATGSVQGGGPAHSVVTLPVGANPTVFLDTFSATGQSISTFPEATGTVADVVFTGTGVLDLAGNTWTMNGTVPQVSGATASPLFPNGMAGSPRQGAGPFSDTNYYSLGTGSDVLDQSVFSECFAFVYSGPIPMGSAQVLLADGASSSRGYYVDLNDGSTNEADLVVGLPGGGGTRIATVNAVVQGLNVVCVGYDGTSGYAKLNLGTTKITAAALSLDSTHITKLGRYDGTGNASVNVGLYEFWASTQTPSDALFTTIQQRYLGLYADTGQALTFSRASTATDVINGRLWTWPPGVPVIGPNGLLLQRASTNNLLNSGTPATQTTASLATGTYTAWQDGTGSVTYSAGTAVATGLPCTVSSSAQSGDCHFTVTSAGTVTATVTSAPTDFQIEPLPARSSYIATAGTIATRNSDTASFTVPQIPTGPWCAAVTATPFGNAPWMISSARGYFTLGSSGTANTFELFSQSTNQMVALVTDGASGQSKRTSDPSGFAVGSTHKLSMCSTNSGFPSLYHDDVSQTGATAGTGTGTISSFSTALTLSQVEGVFLNGYIGRIKLCKTSNAARCQ